MKIVVFLNVFLIFLLSSCEVFKSNSVKQSDSEKVWFILENSIRESWTKEKITQVLGKPDGVFNNLDETGRVLWVYDNKQRGLQRWGVSINHQEQITAILYKPSADGFNDFAIDPILNRWKNYNCKKIAEEVRRGHVFSVDRYYTCDGNRRFDFNRYDEVSSVSIVR